MSSVQWLVKLPVSESLGWALLHSLWQGGLAALALLVALRMTRDARVRYGVACVALASVVGGLATTFLWWGSGLGLGFFARTGLRFSGGEGRWLAGGGNAALTTVTDFTGWLAVLWLAGAMVFQAQSARGWWGARRLRRTGICKPPAEWIDRFEPLRRRMGIERRVELWESSLAQSPLVVGWIRPMVLVPVGLLTAMSPGQVEAILLHELAHVRRGDYLVNLLQRVAEGLLFYHPAVWWISSVIRTEREHCCDDLALDLGGVGAHEYASALAVLEAGRSAFAIEEAAAMAARGGSLMKRVERLLYPERGLDRRLGWGAAGALFAVIVVTVTMIALWQQPARAYQGWLTVHVMTPEEKKAFEELKTDEERKQFFEGIAREGFLGLGESVGTSKEEQKRRVDYANRRFGAKGVEGSKTDRGRIYIKYGPPDEIETHPAKDGSREREAWMYYKLEGIGARVIVEFVDEGDGVLRMTRDPQGKGK